MSVYATAWAKRQKTGSPTRKAVLTALADYADEHGKGWPSVGRLAEDTELSVRAVQNALHELVEAGIISREDREAENGATKSSLYSLPINAAKDRVQDVQGRVQDVQGGRVHVEAGGPQQDVHPHYVEPPLRTTSRSIANATALAQRAGAQPDGPADIAFAKPLKKAKPPPRGSRIPDDLALTDEWLQFALKDGMTHETAVRTFDEFRDYWRGIPGARGTKCDWLATWRNRVRAVSARIGKDSFHGARGNGRADDSLLGAYQRAANRFSH